MIPLRYSSTSLIVSAESPLLSCRTTGVGRGQPFLDAVDGIRDETGLPSWNEDVGLMGSNEFCRRRRKRLRRCRGRAVIVPFYGYVGAGGILSACPPQYTYPSTFKILPIRQNFT